MAVRQYAEEKKIRLKNAAGLYRDANDAYAEWAIGDRGSGEEGLEKLPEVRHLLDASIREIGGYLFKGEDGRRLLREARIMRETVQKQLHEVEDRSIMSEVFPDEESWMGNLPPETVLEGSVLEKPIIPRYCP